MREGYGHRHSIRLPAYDYASAGAYFVTLCTYAREPLFGEIAGDAMWASDNGDIAQAEWQRTPQIRPTIALDVFQLMPNHLHALAFLLDEDAPPVGATSWSPLQGSVDEGRTRATSWSPLRGTVGEGQTRATSWSPLQGSDVGAFRPGPARHSLASFIAGYKGVVASRINARRGTPHQPVWQRNYYEHIVRHEAELARVREYIVNNPLRWALDVENTAAGAKPETPWSP